MIERIKRSTERYLENENNPQDIILWGFVVACILVFSTYLI